MNEKKLQKVDYLLALIPVLIFIFPILIYGGLFFNWYDVDNLIIPLFLAYVFIIVVLSAIGWGSKLVMKLKPIERNKILLFIANFCFTFSVVIFELWLLFLIFDTFTSLYELEGTSQVLWVILLGFFYIVIFKVLGDLHHLPDAYNNVINWVHTKLD